MSYMIYDESKNSKKKCFNFSFSSILEMPDAIRQYSTRPKIVVTSFSLLTVCLCANHDALMLR